METENSNRLRRETREDPPEIRWAAALVAATCAIPVLIAVFILGRAPEPHLYVSIEICPPDKVLTLPPAGEMSRSFLPLCDGQPLRTKYLVNDVNALSNGLGENGMLPWVHLGRYTHTGAPGSGF